MKFFDTVTDIKKLKREYIRLLKQWHPDNYTDEDAIKRAVQTTQEINAQYDKKLEELKARGNSEGYSGGQKKQDYYYWKFDREFRSVIHVLVSFPWISDIELCGCFLWFKVDYRHKDQLKNLRIEFPIRYASKKKLFFICLDRQYHKRTYREMDMDHIRGIYGSRRFTHSHGDPDKPMEEQLLQAR